MVWRGNKEKIEQRKKVEDKELICLGNHKYVRDACQESVNRDWNNLLDNKNGRELNTYG